jgi:hypothetical protein
MQARIGTGMGLVQMLVQLLWRTAAAVAQTWRRLVGQPYRPEKHYMRGPGPKWRAKYAKAEASRRVPQPQQDAAPGR